METLGFAIESGVLVCRMADLVRILDCHTATPSDLRGFEIGGLAPRETVRKFSPGFDLNAPNTPCLTRGHNSL